MKVVIDTNIIFSAILSTNGTIGDLIFNSDNAFEFYSCTYMQYEIEKHWEKLKKISRLSEHQLNVALRKVFLNIKFINEELIPQKVWQLAEKIAHDIDINDTDFIALSLYLKAPLWTGDKVLYSGLKSKKYKHVFNSSELLIMRDTNELT